MPHDLIGVDCKAARKLLGWQMRDLWARSQVSIDSISRLERGEGHLQPRRLRDLRAAFEIAGITFADGEPPCVRGRA